MEKDGVASLHSKQSYATTQRKQEMLQSKKGKYFLQLPHLLLSNYRKLFSSTPPNSFFSEPTGPKTDPFLGKDERKTIFFTNVYFPRNRKQDLGVSP